MTAENNNTTNQEEQKKPFKYKKLIIVFSVILAIILLAISAFAIFLKVGESKLRGDTAENKPSLPVADDITTPEDADAYYNGVAYDYNDKLINILLIGVDRNKPNSSNKHQADAIYLISLDTELNKVNVIAVSRNTLVDVDTYDKNGGYFSTVKQQICLAYTYNSDDDKCSENTVRSVSNLFYGLPISGYYTVFMNSIKDIVDAVGGVPVHITEDMTKISYDFKAGSDVTVTGKNALKYLQYRSGSNALRLERQKKFIASFVSKAKTACLKDLSLPIKMYNKLASNTVTNVGATSAAYLASEAIEADFKILGIEGVTGTDGLYETFTVDEEKLYSLVLDVFYKKQIN